jgi:hypothetical protein
MARILYLHGLFGGYGGAKESRLERDGHEVIAPPLRYAGRDAGSLLRELTRAPRFPGRPPDLFGRWAEGAQEHYDRVRPDLVVGSSMGGLMALRLQSGDTPQVLIAPPWSGRFNLGQLIRDRIPHVPRALLDWGTLVLGRLLREGAGGAAGHIKPATVIVHSPADTLIPVQDSFDLVRLNPPRTPQQRDYFAAVEEGLRRRGREPRSQRLLVVGSNHRCVDPDALDALSAAVAVLLETSFTASPPTSRTGTEA